MVFHLSYYQKCHLSCLLPTIPTTTGTLWSLRTHILGDRLGVLRASPVPFFLVSYLLAGLASSTSVDRDEDEIELATSWMPPLSPRSLIKKMKQLIRLCLASARINKLFLAQAGGGRRHQQRTVAAISFKSMQSLSSYNTCKEKSLHHSSTWDCPP